jgi:hypothetical protein
MSCGKIRQIPPEPYIEFRSFELFDTLDALGNTTKAANVKIYFEDGDGDIGLTQPVEGETDTLNLFFNAFLKKNGVFEPSGTTDIIKSTSFRVPYIDRPGQYKILQGTIDVIIYYYLFNPNDTVKYEFYLKDRAGNLSNIDETCEITFSQPFICE